MQGGSFCMLSRLCDPLVIHHASLIAERLAVSRCPVIIRRNGRQYFATVNKGEATSLQGDKSDVKLEIKDGCPKRAYLMEVRTDLSKFRSIIPNDECFISPIVEVLVPAETSSSSYILKIPHCLRHKVANSKIRVRMICENRNPAVVEVPRGDAGTLYFDIDSKFIELHTTHFCLVICTICQTPFHCLETISSYIFAKFNTDTRNTTMGENDSGSPQTQVHIRHDVEIRPYFCGVVQRLVDFREVKQNTNRLLFSIPSRTVYQDTCRNYSSNCGAFFSTLETRTGNKRDS